MYIIIRNCRIKEQYIPPPKIGVHADSAMDVLKVSAVDTISGFRLILMGNLDVFIYRRYRGCSAHIHQYRRGYAEYCKRLLNRIVLAIAQGK